MRYLNKIIFLNSAHIPYAEIKVDGNVHFAGTQGVGKSTIQRAILFFYNADKSRLGIPKEKKPFQAYYFEYPNSYLVFEVMRNNQPYTIVVFNNRGRICYRFIDCAYQREMMMDSQGEVYSDWTSIRAHIAPHVSISPIVDTYDEYRNIIFGNSNEVRPQFRKYAITESSKYQNIPRTIQNIFLNSKLDAEFIKKTIVDSMTDSELAINTEEIRRQTTPFGQEYRDIMLWEEHNSKGEIVVRKQAEHVIKHYGQLLLIDNEISDLCAFLRYAKHRDDELRPQLEKQRDEKQKEQERIQRLINEEEQKYTEKRDKILREIGALQASLKIVTTKRAEYEQMSIKSIIELVESEPQVRQQLRQQQEVSQRLTAQYQSIAAKFDDLIEQCRQHFKQFELAQQERKNKAEQAMTEMERDLYEEIQEQQDAVHERHNQAVAEIDKTIESLNIELADVRTELVRINLEHHYADEIEKAKQHIAALEQEKVELTGEKKLQVANKEARLKQIEAEDKAHDKEVMDLRARAQADIDALTQEITKLEALQQALRGSVYEWLEDNLKGWEYNIGKVVDERILYNTNLHPQTAPGSSLYGMSVDLSGIERNTRTPQEIAQEKSALEQQLSKREGQFKNDLAALQQQREKQRVKDNDAMRQLNAKIDLVEMKLLQLPNKVKAAQAALIDWQRKDDQYREQRIADNEQRRYKIDQQLVQQKEAKAEEQQSCERQLQALQKRRDDELHKIRATIGHELYKMNKELEEHRKEMMSQEAQYRADRDTALAGQGVDTARLRKVENQIEELNGTLTQIEQQRGVYFGFLKDKKEYLDKENEFKHNLREKEHSRDAADYHYRNLQTRHRRDKQFIDRALEETCASIKTIEDGATAFNQMITVDDNCPTALKDLVGTTRKTGETCLALVNKLRNTIYHKRDVMDTFQKSVNTFKSNFSPKNTFNFSTELNSMEDYNSFASNLKEFIDNDMIKVYKSRISKRYGQIMSRISREVGDIMNHSSDIDKTIHDINHDFSENNFVGVIKDISLRKVESDNPLMRKLVEIKRFYDENAMNMDEMNLFSDAEKQEAVGKQTVKLLFDLLKVLERHGDKGSITLNDTFRLEFNIVENDNSTGWIEKISNVGSDGTDVLVKAMVNIMLINVFKKKMSRKFSDFRLHCMMDEIGKLHPANVEGILDFASRRNIFLINSSPVSYSVSAYRYNYLLVKDKNANTIVKTLISQR